MFDKNCRFYIQNRSADEDHHSIDWTTSYDFEGLGLLDIIKKHTKKCTEKHIFLTKTERNTYQVECLEFYDRTSEMNYLMLDFIIKHGMKSAIALFGTSGRRLTIICLDPTADQKRALEEYFQPPISLWELLFSDSDDDEECDLSPDLKGKTWSYTIERPKIKSSVSVQSIKIPAI